MAKLLLNLRDVPDDEAEEVRALLDEHRIAYYETRPSLWGVSAGGIWLKDAEQATLARRELDAYQAARAERAREDRAQALREGRAPSTWSGIRDRPLQAIAAALGILLMMAIATLPFLMFAQ